MNDVMRAFFGLFRRRGGVPGWRGLFAAMVFAGIAPWCVQAAEVDGSRAPLADLTAAFGGWRHSGLTNEGERFVAAYPRPPVDRGAQRFRTLIEGRLRHVDRHARKPPTLVVNGNPTPLYTDDQGAFARPWAFGAGSNSIERFPPMAASVSACSFTKPTAASRRRNCARSSRGMIRMRRSICT
jgi:uncharacterized protein YfaP (DUF2135 family)